MDVYISAYNGMYAAYHLLLHDFDKQCDMSHLVSTCKSIGMYRFQTP